MTALSLLCSDRNFWLLKQVQTREISLRRSYPKIYFILKYPADTNIIFRDNAVMLLNQFSKVN